MWGGGVARLRGGVAGGALWRPFWIQCDIQEGGRECKNVGKYSPGPPPWAPQDPKTSRDTVRRLKNPKGCCHHPRVGDGELRPREVVGACPRSRGQ